MPLYLSVPLPGPFRYGRRIGGAKRRKRGPSEPDPNAMAIAVALIAAVVLVVLLGWWGVLLLAAVAAVLIAGRAAERRKREAADREQAVGRR